MGTTNSSTPLITKLIALSPKGGKYEFELHNEHIVKYKNKPVKANIVEQDGFTFIVVNNKKYPVEILEKNQNRYEVLINNVSYTFFIETPFSYTRRKMLNEQKQTTKTEVITAPIPGKIVDVLVDENQQVREGDTLVILEAMKMQNEITSHVSGKVKKIMIKKNDTVLKDDVLLEIVK
jgi:biotin carboxyl carrier protein